MSLPCGFVVGLAFGLRGGGGGDTTHSGTSTNLFIYPKSRRHALVGGVLWLDCDGEGGGGGGGGGGGASEGTGGFGLCSDDGWLGGVVVMGWAHRGGAQGWCGDGVVDVGLGGGGESGFRV